MAHVTAAKRQQPLREEECHNYVVAFTRGDFVAMTATSMALTKDSLLFDTGASVNICPRLYAEGYPLIPDEPLPRLKAVIGQTIRTYGMKKLTYVLSTKDNLDNLIRCVRREDTSSFSISTVRQRAHNEDRQRRIHFEHRRQRSLSYRKEGRTLLSDAGKKVELRRAAQVHCSDLGHGED